MLESSRDILANDEKISVVIPTYNRANLILDAIESVVAQSQKPYEIIIVDDGSSDQTQQIIEDWKKKNANKTPTLHYIKQENQGGNVARNRGIREAKGNLIAFLDSDDTWHNTKLEKQIPLFKKDNAIGAVYCGLIEINIETGSLILDNDRKYAKGSILNALLIRDVTGPTSTFIIRKSVFEQVGFFDEKLQARQDWDMWIRIATAFKIEAVEENLVNMRHHSGERTASNPLKEIIAYQEIRKKYSKLLKNKPTTLQQKAKAAYYKRMGRVHFHQKISNTKALKFYLLGIINYPFDFDGWAALLGFFIPSSLRTKINKSWNHFFSKTFLQIRSH